ncbi:hypothetical protein BDV25DRAFT_170582 [Aspergillus avenaceus]|uniref:Uncharacterized protein n=1 Tax=Aspergillus avenaceus TaxID=36643 RepID=A0A5N6U114_ASPAV|nr:hypothetical protein BDV25DRAFT_170582 [Aspergillus avenaceus]
MESTPLESLPAELRIQILLNCPDLKSVQSIVQASTAYELTYKRIEHELLLNLLNANYDGLVDMVDAVTAIRSSGLYAFDPAHKENIYALLDCWRRSEEICRLQLPSAGYRIEMPNTDEILKLLDLHDIAKYFLDDYSRSALCPVWMNSTRWNSEVLPLSLSIIEKRRFMRGFYRLQIYANIFGHIEYPVHKDHDRIDNNWLDKTFTMEEAWRVLFSPMAPWEIAELGCVWRHIYDKIEPLYTEIADNLMQYRMNQIGFPEEITLPADCIQLDPDDLHQNDLEILPALVATGSTFCFEFIRLESFLDRRDLILSNGRQCVWCFPEICLAADPSHMPLLHPAEQFNFGRDRQGMIGFLETLPPTKRPNLAFSRYWIYDDYPESPVFESYFQMQMGQHLWKWGYAIWEDERLHVWDAPQEYPNP